jgi:SAM-dependent methyltransferase
MEKLNMPACVGCGDREWIELRDPSKSKSITTAGCIIDEPLGKSQCAACGMLQRTRYRYLADTDFYERSYLGYHARPGNTLFNRQRYGSLARWISASIGDYAPKSIVEVGCGRGGTLCEMKAIHPDAEIEAIEPSVEDAATARELGFRIYTQKLDLAHLPNRTYGLAFSSQVLQHTSDPVAFLTAMRDIADDDGLVVLIVQDASIPTSELLYSDQNFSFLPTHLERLTQAAGLRLLSWQPAPVWNGLMFSQLVVCSKYECKGPELSGGPPPGADHQHLQDLYRKRTKYLEAWPRIEDYLLWKTTGVQNVYNFGGGMFTYLLACYCEEYWKRVVSCAVDGFAGRCLGKDVIALEALRQIEGDCVVIGTSPAIQKELAARVTSLGWDAVRWDNFIDG